MSLLDMKWIRALLRSRLATDERGVTALITALALSTVLLGFCGLATDVVMWEVSQRALQGTADQAALAAATAYRNAGESSPLGNNATAQNGAYATAIRSGYPASVVSVGPYSGGTTCTGTGSNAGCVQVTITQAQTLYFTSLFLPANSVVAAATAVGTCNGCGSGSYTAASNGGDPCVMALDASGSGVITLSGTPTLSLSSCNLYNNSPNTNATILNGSGATIEGCSATNPCGSKAFLAQPDTPSGGSIDIPIITNAAPAPDPYAGLSAPTPASSCISNFPANPVPSGTYCPGNINNQNVTFATGATIIITGGLNTHGNANLSGSGVTLYVLGGGTINGNSTINISGPTSGAYAGLAVWFGDTSDVTWDGTNSSSFSGAIYAPKATVTYGGNVNSSNTCTRLIAASIDLHGTPSGSFNNSGCSNVAGPVLTASGVSGTTAYTGAPLLVQ